MEMTALQDLGGRVRYGSGVTGLITEDDVISGVMVGEEAVRTDAVILACGGFEPNDDIPAKAVPGRGLYFRPTMTSFLPCCVLPAKHGR
ncbi:hypothetical protein [Loktanella sp. DSM 29012]|uniref:hypothetical protein n=1 Tax=Loktanella sp. DSM 29012 TaxID=1881056 RepID=UPI00115FA763|nr:hypothetical protein [Loktanella sp. DSM 29012]